MITIDYAGIKQTEHVDYASAVTELINSGYSPLDNQFFVNSDGKIASLSNVKECPDCGSEHNTIGCGSNCDCCFSIERQS